MRVQRKEREFAGIDVTSFADVAFLLIIFFILTTTFVRPAGRKMQIPSGSSEPSEVEQKQMTVLLTPEKIEIGEEDGAFTIDQLRLKLADANFPARPPEERMVVLESREDVTYERYFQVVTAIADAGGILALVDETE